MRIKAILSIIILLTSLCSCTKKTTTTIVPANQTQELSPKGMVYALPKTCLLVRVDAEHISIIPGPYAQYAEKYMGIANAPLSSKNQWEVSKIDVFSYNEADMSALFVVEPSVDFNSDFLNLTKEGLIIPAGSANFYKPDLMQIQTAPSLDLDYLDLSPTPFIAAERTTHYSRVLQDSVFIRVPVHKTIVVEKSREDKAREAADFIFSLRKRRYELLAGDADFVAEGKAVETVLTEISRLEKEYLSLFIGKSKVSTTTHWFNYTPDANNEETSIIFRFSNSRGVLSPADLSGSPVLISFKTTENWEGLDIFNAFAKEKDTPRTDLVYYRLPVPTNVKIYDSQVEFISKTMTIYQLGPMVRLPSNMIR
jgi:hypothetical protein